MSSTIKIETHESYVKRIERVILYMTRHLEQPMDLNRLAEIANLSSYHFHRIYMGITDETLAHTVRRLRLHQAAAALLYSKDSLSLVAKRVGYGSVASFCRAFKKTYQLTPGAYRKRRGISNLIQKNTTDQSTTLFDYDVTIEKRESQCVLAMRHIGDYMNIGHTVEQLILLKPVSELLKANSHVVIIFLDDPTITTKTALRADICITLPQDYIFTAQKNIQTTNIAGGRFAVLNHTGPFAEHAAALNWLFTQWLPLHNELPADRPPFEVHTSNPKIVSPVDLQTKLFLALKD